MRYERGARVCLLGSCIDSWLSHCGLDRDVVNPALCSQNSARFHQRNGDNLRRSIGRPKTVNTADASTIDQVLTSTTIPFEP
ncbi:uncharacterized protein MYCFIDRAFT_211365 [Pseudocercospora fijiensis CIRAD86]|uniref:Uncharacterized protein n=1 Tax=Pseudocercospora fijiensis (strain CIRAD86) TaxID=383855 RepID=M2Z110_PSEFD|nr:uncharacterized protein MYCFIDRAFT_211365 [Pseudocercospora fijiensis CIRAD86]EME83530.1 hypothetical protein MYCFIDRAFT_211365 [Pseudocercospora fijiensis CIRAD86]